MDDVGKRSRAVQRQLPNVEELPATSKESQLPELATEADSELLDENSQEAGGRVAQALRQMDWYPCFAGWKKYFLIQDNDLFSSRQNSGRIGLDMLADLV